MLITITPEKMIMTDQYRNAKKPKPQKTRKKNIKSFDSMPEPSVELIDAYLNHVRAIDTLKAFLNLTPPEDEYHQVLVLISEQINRTFLDVIPVFASSSAKSRGPTNASQLQAR